MQLYYWYSDHTLLQEHCKTTSLCWKNITCHFASINNGVFKGPCTLLQLDGKGFSYRQSCLASVVTCMFKESPLQNVLYLVNEEDFT